MYKIVETKDASPSLILSQGEVSEMMHNSYGAFSESLYIYEQALIKAHELQWPIQVYSLGLGLGYNEWICIGFCLKHNLKLELQTSESESWLYEVLNTVLTDSKSDKPEVKSSMLKVISLVAQHYGLSNDSILKKAQLMQADGHWKLYSSLRIESLNEIKPCNIIFYDAFSKKMSPALWSEDFLNKFLTSVSKEKCIFSTYACTGALKRALSDQSYKLEARLGFQGKRESTLAIKNSNDLT